MARTKKSKRHARTLILGHLEGISSKIFSGFPKQLTDLIGREHGVYALYKGQRLYYIGLATNLRSRIKQHLRDKHAGKWDKFSLYLVRKVDHIRELESIVMRIANPAGNDARGKLATSDNLRKPLDRAIAEEQLRQRKGILNPSKKIAQRKAATPRRRKALERKSVSPSLAKYTSKSFRIRAIYKNRTYRAVVNKSGSIRYNSILYNSPTMAGKAVVGRLVNGWTFWSFKNKKGEWVKLDELRK